MRNSLGGQSIVRPSVHDRYEYRSLFSLFFVVINSPMFYQSLSFEKWSRSVYVFCSSATWLSPFWRVSNRIWVFRSKLYVSYFTFDFEYFLLRDRSRGKRPTIWRIYRKRLSMWVLFIYFSIDYTKEKQLNFWIFSLLPQSYSHWRKRLCTGQNSIHRP